MFRSAAVILGFSAFSASAIAASLDMSKGPLNHSGDYSTQVVAVTNRTDELMTYVKIECGFFRNGALLAAGEGYAQNVGPKQTAYAEVIASDARGADSTDCRVSN